MSERTCERCGASTADKMAGTRFCSPRCQQRQRRLDLGHAQPEDPGRVCVVCDQSLVGTFRNKIYCSPRCSAWARRHPGQRRLPSAEPRTCRRCDASLDGRDIRAVYCSSICFYRDQDGSQVGHLVECAQCGGPFVAGRKTAKLCSPQCRRAARLAYDQRRISVVARGVRDGERFTRLQVFERDEWTCGLCREPVDRTLRWPDPRSPSLDHVIPLVRDGEHRLDNVQCAHLRCNLRKSAAVTVAPDPDTGGRYASQAEGPGRARPSEQGVLAFSAP